jgi:hypothetical protein
MKSKIQTVLIVLNVLVLAALVMGMTYNGEGIFVIRAAGAAFSAQMPGDADCRWRVLGNGVHIWCNGSKPIAGMGPIISNDGKRLLFELNSSSSNLLPNGERLSVGITMNGGAGKIWSLTAEPEGMILRNEYTGEVFGPIGVCNEP